MQQIEQDYMNVPTYREVWSRVSCDASSLVLSLNSCNPPSLGLTQCCCLQEFCLLNGAGECSKPKSVLRFFDGTYAYLDSIFNNTSLNNVSDVLYAAQTYDDTKELLTLFVAKDANMTRDNAESWITRMFVPVGWPLEGYNDTSDREEDQR